MAEVDYLAEDFKEVTDKSDDVVYELLKLKECSEASKTNTLKPLGAEPLPRKTEIVSSQATLSQQVAADTAIPNSRMSNKPIAVLNTRIPQELSDLIDDLVYQSKKRGQPTSKQSIAIEALWSHVKALGLGI